MSREPLTDADRATLLRVAADAVHDALAFSRTDLPDVEQFDARLRSAGATFVTLERGEDLLGCIGTLEPVRALGLDVAHNALAAAFADPRLPPVNASDYEVMSIKVSVLSTPEPLIVGSYDDLARTVRPAVDGLVLEAGPYRSTLLPSVWPKVRDVEEFLSVLWRKAGLHVGTWPPITRISRYSTDEFADPGPRTPLTAMRS
jgi:AmmeMemoRadiSam system protein A